MSFVFRETGDGAPAPRPSGPIYRLVALVRAIIRVWALVGGAILLALVVMTAVSAAMNLTVNRPLPGEYELVKHLIAVAIFCFLPFCQLTGANVTVDIFTEGMSARSKAAMKAFSALFAIVFSLVLLRQMSLGFADYLRYPETTATLHVPLWTAFPPILVSLVLLLAAALVTAGEGIAGVRGRPSEPHRPAVAE